MLSESLITSTGASFSIVIGPIPYALSVCSCPDSAGSDDEWRIKARWALHITGYTKGFYNGDKTTPGHVWQQGRTYHQLAVWLKSTLSVFETIERSQ
jgi:hypothetical protein